MPTLLPSASELSPETPLPASELEGQLRPLFLQALKDARAGTAEAWQGVLRQAWEQGARPWSWVLESWGQNRLFGGLLALYVASVSGLVTWVLMLPVTPLVGYLVGELAPVLIALGLFWLVGARVAAALPLLVVDAFGRWRAARFPHWQGLDKATCVVYLAKPTGHEDEPPPAEFRLTDTGKWAVLGKPMSADEIPQLEPVFALASGTGALFAMSLSTGAVYFHWSENAFLAARHEALADCLFRALKDHPVVAAVQARAQAACEAAFQ